MTNPIPYDYYQLKLILIGWVVCNTNIKSFDEVRDIAGAETGAYNLSREGKEIMAENGPNDCVVVKHTDPEILQPLISQFTRVQARNYLSMGLFAMLLGDSAPWFAFNTMFREMTGKTLL